MVLADEPKITDWLSVWFSLGSGVIALLALVAATIAVRATIQTNRSQSEQLKRLEDAQERESASHFAVWVEGNPKTRALRMMYYNGSALPIYDVAITVDVDIANYVGSGWAATFPPLSPAQSPVMLMSSSSNNKIGAELLKMVEAARDEDGNVKFFPLLQAIRLHVRFRDGNGVTWARHADGRLERVIRPQAISQPLEPGTQQQVG